MVSTKLHFIDHEIVTMPTFTIRYLNYSIANYSESLDLMKLQKKISAQKVCLFSQRLNLACRNEFIPVALRYQLN